MEDGQGGVEDGQRREWRIVKEGNRGLSKEGMEDGQGGAEDGQRSECRMGRGGIGGLSKE